MSSEIYTNTTPKQTDTITYPIIKDNVLINTIEEKSPTHIISTEDNENEYCEIDITETDDISDVSASAEKLNSVVDGTIPSIIGKIVDTFDEDTKDGQISATKQRATEDCWLLSGINALSYTEKGKEIIKNCLEYENGYTIVHLKGIGTYTIEDKELELVKSQLSGSKQYSKGDDDMLIFELAIEEALDDIANGEIVLDPNAPWWMEGQDELSATKEGGDSSTKGGWGLELMYLVTGKTGNRYSSKDGMEKALLEFEKNGNKNMVMTASAHEAGTALDISGNEIRIGAPHAYAIKEVTDGVVTLTNPWNSGEEIQFTMETFLETFSGVETLNLSENNQKQDLISREFKFDKEGNKIFIFHDKNRDDYNNIREVKYSSEGKPAEIVTKRNDRITSKKVYDPYNGKLAWEAIYGETSMVEIYFNPDTREQTYILKTLDKNVGKNIKNGSDKPLALSMYEYDKLISSGILNRKQFSTKDIKNLLKLSDNDWLKVKEYLSENPNAEYKDIENYINNNQKSKDFKSNILDNLFKNR